MAAQTRPDACEMASPNLWWIAEQQECLRGSLQQIMSITYCVENPSPLFSFTPQQKTNGPHSLLFGRGVNYCPLPIWTTAPYNSPVRPRHNSPSLVFSADICCSCGAIDTSTWSMHETQLKAFRDKGCVISSSRLDLEFAVRLIVCQH